MRPSARWTLRPSAKATPRRQHGTRPEKRTTASKYAGCGGRRPTLILTRLELYLRGRSLVLADVARLSGYTERHFRRLREEEVAVTRGGILLVTAAVKKLSRERVKPSAIFERADAFLRGSGRFLSDAHRADRVALD